MMSGKPVVSLFMPASAATRLEEDVAVTRRRFGCKTVSSAVSEEVAAKVERYLVGPQPELTFFMPAALAVKLDEVSGA